MFILFSMISQCDIRLQSANCVIFPIAVEALGLAFLLYAPAWYGRHAPAFFIPPWEFIMR